jgi:uncharacterized oxidoreductase
MPVVTADTLEKLVYHIFNSLGAPEEEAQTIAQIIVDSNLAGHDSHGVNMVPSYVQAVRGKMIIPGAPTITERETASTARIDGGLNFGHVVAKRAMELAIEKARKTDIACVVARRLHHIGRVGTYPEIAAKAGFIGITACSTGPGAKEQAPFGGTDRRLGTNPLSIAFPSNLEGPVLLDMATSVVAAGKVRIARSRGTEIPAHWVLDSDGKPSTDPMSFFDGGTLMPLGAGEGHKGYGLAFAVDVLGGILSRDGHSQEGDHPITNSTFIVALNPEVFLSLDEMKEEVAALGRYVKKSPPSAGVQEVQYPGEKEAKGRKKYRVSGIDVEDSTWQGLLTIVKEQGLEEKIGPLP